MAWKLKFIKLKIKSASLIISISIFSNSSLKIQPQSKTDVRDGGWMFFKKWLF